MRRDAFQNASRDALAGQQSSSPATGHITILTGPSGAGKSSVVKNLREIKNIRVFISASDRGARTDDIVDAGLGGEPRKILTPEQFDDEKNRAGKPFIYESDNHSYLLDLQAICESQQKGERVILIVRPPAGAEELFRELSKIGLPPQIVYLHVNPKVAIDRLDRQGRPPSPARLKEIYSSDEHYRRIAHFIIETEQSEFRYSEYKRENATRHVWSMVKNIVDFREHASSFYNGNQVFQDPRELPYEYAQRVADLLSGKTISVPEETRVDFLEKRYKMPKEELPKHRSLEAILHSDTVLKIEKRWTDQGVLSLDMVPILGGERAKKSDNVYLLAYELKDLLERHINQELQTQSIPPIFPGMTTPTLTYALTDKLSAQENSKGIYRVDIRMHSHVSRYR